MQTPQQRVRKQVRVCTVILFDPRLQHVKGRILLAAIGEDRSLIIREFWIWIRGPAGFRVMGQAVEFGWRPESEASFHEITMIVRTSRHVLHSLTCLGHFA